WIIDGDLYFQAPEIRAAEALCDLGGVGQRAALHVKPSQIAEARGLNHKRVTLPLAHGVTIPPRLWMSRQRPPIGKDLAYACVGFVKNHSHLRSLYHLARLAVVVKLHDSHRQTVRVRVVFAVLGDTLAVQFRGPRLKRQSIGERGTKVPKRA